MHERHAASCFQGTLNGWNKQSPQKRHIRESSLLHQLQQNLTRYEDQNNRMVKSKSIPISKLDVQKVRLPLLSNNRSNANLSNNQIDKNIKQVRESKNSQHEFCLKNVKVALPLRMKTLMIYERNQNEVEEARNTKMKNKKQRRNGCQNSEKQKFRKKVVINFERIKEIGKNFTQFSDQRFFKDMACMQEKSKSVKLCPITK